MALFHILFLSFFLTFISAKANAQALDDDIFNAARNGDSAAIEHYIDEGGDLNAVNDEGFSLFILAAYYGYEDVLIELLDNGANACIKDTQGNNAFMGAAFRGHGDIATWLLENTDCGVNTQNEAGQTALMMAALFARNDIVQLLLDHGADPAITDFQGNTAASLANAQGSTSTVELLAQATP